LIQKQLKKKNRDFKDGNYNNSENDGYIVKENLNNDDKRDNSDIISNHNNLEEVTNRNNQLVNIQDFVFIRTVTPKTTLQKFIEWIDTIIGLVVVAIVFFILKKLLFNEIL